MDVPGIPMVFKEKQERSGHGGMKLKQVGERFGIGDAAVSVTCKRLLEQATKDRKVQETLAQISNLLNVEL